MIKSHRQSSTWSLNQSKETCEYNSKKYRCDCCKDKKYHDYNRENRLKRQSASSKRLNIASVQSIRYSSQQNNINLPNTNLISSITNYEVKGRDLSKEYNLPSILQSPHIIEQHLKQDNNLRLKTPIMDMKQYCKSLFSSTKKQKIIYRIEVILNGDQYAIDFDSSEKMKLAIGQLKLLIQNSQNNRIKNQ